MSNDLSIFVNNVPAHVRAEEDEVSKKLAGSTGTIKRISIRGGVWRLMSGNEELGMNDNRTFDVIIVDAADRIYRTYYAKKYVEGENANPACWSTDGQAPANTVPSESRQADTCASCPQNIKGSAEGDRRACRIQHRVAVVLPEDPEGALMQMIFPATSLLGDAKNGYYPLRAYAKLLTQNNVRLDGVITQMKFDTDSATPKVMFKPVGFVEKHVIDILSERRMAGECQPLLDMDFSGMATTNTGVGSVASTSTGDDPDEEPQTPVRATATPKVAKATGKGVRHPGFEVMSAKQFLAASNGEDTDESDDEDSDDGDVVDVVEEPKKAKSSAKEKPVVVDQNERLKATLAKFRKPAA